MAGLSGLPARNRREHEAFEALGAAQARQPEDRVFRVRKEVHRLPRCRSEEVRDLPWSAMLATVVVEVYRVRQPANAGCAWSKWNNCSASAVQQEVRRCCGTERCEGGSGIAVGRFRVVGAAGIADRQAVRLQRWAEETEESAATARWELEEIHLGKKEEFLTVVSNLTRRASLLVRQGTQGKRRSTNTSGRNSTNGKRDRLKLPAWTCGNRSPKAFLRRLPRCKIVFDKFHVMQHANDAIDEVRQG